MNFEISGVDSVQKILEEILPRHANNLMRSAIHGVASTIAKDAKQNAPHDTGTLRKAIKAKRKKSRPETPTSVVMVEHGGDAKHDAFYWRFVEYGTSGKTAQGERPFIRPARDSAYSRFNEVLTQQFGKKLEAMAIRAAKKRAKK